MVTDNVAGREGKSATRTQAVNLTDILNFAYFTKKYFCCRVLVDDDFL